MKPRLTLAQFLGRAIILILCSLFLHNRISTIQAKEEYDSSLEVTYIVQENGDTTVEQDFTFINKTPTTYISQYGLTISSPRVSNVKVRSNGSTLKPEVVQTDNQTSIGITFPDQVVGENKKRSFQITYQNPDLATVNGKVLELTVPALSNATEYKKYTTNLITPGRFGLPTRVRPSSFESEQKGGQVVTKLANKNGQSVFVLFGDHQIFDLSLEFFLSNPTNNTTINQIALPPDTRYQKMQYLSIEPKPEKIETDKDGNWIATYHLQSNTQLNISAKAKTLINLEPNTTVPQTEPSTDLLTTQEFWEVKDTSIQKIGKQHQTAESIYDFIVSEFTYNYDRALGGPTRLGAKKTLTDPSQAVCQEFSDTFIALARANSIPARLLTGFAYAENSKLRPLSLVEDVLHAWPEYYDTKQQAWIPVDPTWGNTTGGVDYFNQFDLKHIVFAINGYSSTRPLSAGSYKLTNDPEKNINVEFGQSFEEVDFQISQKLEKPTGPSFPFLAPTTLIIENKTGQAWYNLDLKLETSDKNSSVTLRQPKIDALLPFEVREIPLRVRHSHWLLPKKIRITSTVGNHSSTLDNEIIAQPIIIDHLSDRYVQFALGFTAVITPLATGSLLVHRRRRRRLVRR